MERVHDKLPEIRVVFVSIHRAPQKKAQWDQVNEGNPRLDLYLPDLLHFKHPAYVGLTAILKPELEKLWASAR